MPNKEPKVSVIIPTYNRADMLPRAIKSVLYQTFQDFELIIVDDASEDNTEEVVKKFQEQDERIKFLKHRKNKGGSAARNTGAEFASGKYIAYLDSDDYWLPKHLKLAISLMKENSSDGLYGNFYVLKKGNKMLSNIQPKKEKLTMADYILSAYGDVRTSTLLFKKTAFLEVKFDNQLKKYQDWDLAIRFDNHYDFTFNPEATVILARDASNRMSNTMNHSATKKFLKKHNKKGEIQNQYLGRFYLRLAMNTLEFEGQNQYFRKYLRKGKELTSFKKLGNTLRLFLLSQYLPIINFRVLHKMAFKFKKFLD